MPPGPLASGRSRADPGGRPTETEAVRRVPSAAPDPDRPRRVYPALPSRRLRMDLLRTVPQAHRGFASDATAEVVQLTVDGRAVEGRDGEWLATLLDRLDQADGQRTATEGGPGGHSVPHVCFQPELGPIQTCDTCFVEVDGALARACATPVRAGLVVATRTAASGDAREEGMHRLLGNHRNLFSSL